MLPPSLRPRLVGLALTGLALGLSLPAAGQVVLSGILGGRALLLVGASAPKAVAPGETFQGVRLVSLDKDSALLEQDGQRFTLRLGDSPVQVKPGSGVARPANGKRITLTSDSAGHFKSQGSINGQIMQFVVDTGATVVSIGRPDAERMGLAFLGGQSVQMQTANGTAQGWRIQLHSVRIGDVEVFDVDAVVTPQAMPVVLLGNSFLDRFQMHRVSDQMVLEKRL
jgi:aspartyl protease family protein